MTKKYFAALCSLRSQKGGDVFHFSGKARKNETLSLLFARAKRVRKAFNFFVMY